MNLKIFSVYDSKALCYGVPFFMPSTGAAVRAFSDLANDPQSTVHRHGSDFVLYQIGNFDDSKGVVKSIEPYVNLGIGSDFLPVRVPAGVERIVAAQAVNPVELVEEKNGGSK